MVAEKAARERVSSSTSCGGTALTAKKVSQKTDELAASLGRGRPWLGVVCAR